MHVVVNVLTPVTWMGRLLLRSSKPEVTGSKQQEAEATEGHSTGNAVHKGIRSIGWIQPVRSNDICCAQAGKEAHTLLDWKLRHGRAGVSISSCQA